MLINSKQGWQAWERSQGNSGSSLHLPLLNQGLRQGGTQGPGLLEHCTLAALRRIPYRSLGAHSHFSLINVRTESARSLQTSGGGLILNCLPCPFFPSRILCEEQRCTEQGVLIQGTSGPRRPAHPCRHTCTHKKQVSPHQRDPWHLKPGQHPRRMSWGCRMGCRDRQRSAACRSGGGWRDEDLGEGPEQPLDQMQMPPLLPFPSQVPAHIMKPRSLLLHQAHCLPVPA